MMYVLEVSPFVLAYRFQYPWPLAKARRLIDDYIFCLADSAPILCGRDVISMDVVVTSEEVGGELKYLIGSHKLKSDLKNKKVKRRIALERKEASDLGYLYFLFSRDELLDVAGKSAKQIFLWGIDTDFNSVWSDARHLADWVYENYVGGSLESILEKASINFKIDIDRTYGLFSAAINLGYLFVDICLPISASSDLQLISPSNACPPWEDSRLTGHRFLGGKSRIVWAKSR